MSRYYKTKGGKEIELLPTPRSWKPVAPTEKPKPFDPVVLDSSIHSDGWDECRECRGSGRKEIVEQKTGYCVRKVVNCPACHGQGGSKPSP